MINWRTEYKAWQFAMATIDDLIEVHPGALCMVGWEGLQSLKRCLIAAWVSRNMQ